MNGVQSVLIILKFEKYVIMKRFKAFTRMRKESPLYRSILRNIVHGHS